MDFIGSLEHVYIIEQAWNKIAWMVMETFAPADGLWQLHSMELPICHIPNCHKNGKLIKIYCS